MHQAVVALDVAMGPAPQPVEEFGAVRGIENVLQGVVLAAEFGAAPATIRR